MNENKLLGVIFFEIKLLLQPDVVFDSESNGRNLSSLVPPGDEKKIFSILKTPTSTHDVILKKLKIIFFSPPGGAREQKLQPIDSESKTTSGCSNSFISKKITPNSLFSFYQYKLYRSRLFRQNFICFILFIKLHVIRVCGLRNNMTSVYMSHNMWQPSLIRAFSTNGIDSVVWKSALSGLWPAYVGSVGMLQIEPNLLPREFKNL